MCFEGPCTNVPLCSWWDYINTGGKKISVNTFDVKINFDTMVLGRRLRIIVTSFLISLITCTANGILCVVNVWKEGLCYM